MLPFLLEQSHVLLREVLYFVGQNVFVVVQGAYLQSLNFDLRFEVLKLGENFIEELRLFLLQSLPLLAQVVVSLHQFLNRFCLRVEQLYFLS